MICWIIERWLDGAWQHVRDVNKMPLMFMRKCEAQIALRRLPRGRYRITGVRD